MCEMVRRCCCYCEEDCDGGVVGDVPPPCYITESKIFCSKLHSLLKDRDFRSIWGRKAKVTGHLKATALWQVPYSCVTYEFRYHIR